MARTPKHGTASEYTNYGCRCDRCRAALAKLIKAYRAKKRARGQCQECLQPVEGHAARCPTHQQMNNARQRRTYQPHPRAPRVPQHGTRTEYQHGCRCELCRVAQAAYYASRQRAYDKRKTEVA